MTVDGQSSDDALARIQELASQMRQALQTCSVHSVGPLAAYDRCTQALENGEINEAQFREIGERITRRSVQQMTASTDRSLPSVHSRTIIRERRLVGFVRTLFGPGATRGRYLPTGARLVAVVGKGRECPRETYELGGAVGHLLAGIDGIALVTGGLGGVMAAAADGCGEAGGCAIDLLPATDSSHRSRPGSASLVLRTGLPAGVRNFVIANVADAMVALPGSHGTMQEILFSVDRGIPVWGIGSHSVSIPGVEYVSGLQELRGRLVRFASEPI